jgi:hypothetical protein
MWSQGHAVYSHLQIFHFVITKDQPDTTYLDSSLRDHKDMSFIHLPRYFITWSQGHAVYPLIQIFHYVITRTCRLSTYPDISLCDHKDMPLIHFSKYFLTWSRRYVFYPLLLKFHFVITKYQPLTTYLDSSIRDHKEEPLINSSSHGTAAFTYPQSQGPSSRTVALLHCVKYLTEYHPVCEYRGVRQIVFTHALWWQTVRNSHRKYKIHTATNASCQQEMPPP